MKSNTFNDTEWVELHLKGMTSEFPYLISNKGDVMSLNYNRTGQSRICKCKKGSNWHRMFKFAGAGVYSIASIVLSIFGNIPKPHSSYVVYHMDGNPANDSYDNLTWMSKQRLAFLTMNKKEILLRRKKDAAIRKQRNIKR